MALITKNDLSLKYGEQELINRTDNDNIGAVDDDILAEHIKNAESIINGYLKGRYAVPLSSDNAPQMVKGIACTLTRKNYYDKDGAPDHVESDYKGAIKLLQDISSGKIVLDVKQNVASTNPSGSVKARAAKGDKQFTTAGFGV